MGIQSEVVSRSSPMARMLAILTPPPSSAEPAGGDGEEAAKRRPCLRQGSNKRAVIGAVFEHFSGVKFYLNFRGNLS